MEEGYVFDVGGVGEHVDWLDGNDVVCLGEECDVAGLGAGVATDVHDARCTECKELLDNGFVHAAPGWVGDDDIWAAVGVDEVGDEDVFHVPGKEGEVMEVVDLAIDAGVFDCGLDVLNADNLVGEV